MATRALILGLRPALMEKKFGQELGPLDVELLHCNRPEGLRAAFFDEGVDHVVPGGGWTSRRGLTRCEKCFGTATGLPCR
jgi:hypothetical protein